MKIALITDTHWGVRNDAQNFLEYFRRFFHYQFFPYLEKNNIDTVIHLGDIVDRRKYINYITLRHLKEEFINKLEKKNIDLHIIAGNHDVPYKNSNDINAMRELFDRRENCKIYWEPETVNFDGTDICLMPWINNSNYAQAVEHMKDTPAQILMGHLEIAGCLMMRGMTNEHGMQIDDFDKFDMVMSGHFHTKSTTKNIHYLGTPYQITWSDYKDPKGFHVFDTDTRQLEFIQNPYEFFFKVYYDDAGKKAVDVLVDNEYFFATQEAYVKVIVQSKENPFWFDQYMDKLYMCNPASIQIVDDHLNLNLEDDEDIVNEAEDTVTILSKYIENMETNVPKKRLDNLMRNLYNEALYMEV